MNGKFIIIFTLMTSMLVVFLATQVCGVWTSALSPETNPIMSLYDFENFENAASEDTCVIGTETEVATSQLSETTEYTELNQDVSTLTQGAGGLFGGTGSIFLDGLKLVFGIISMFFGLPIIAFIFAVGVPNTIAWILSAFIVLFQSISIIEFIRGGSV